MRQLLKHKLLTAVFVAVFASIGLQSGAMVSAAPTCGSGHCNVTCKDKTTASWDALHDTVTFDHACDKHGGIATVDTNTTVAGGTAPQQVYNGTDNPQCSGPTGKAKQVTTPAGYQCIYQNYIVPAGYVLSALVGIAVVTGIVIGAIQYITSSGDPQKVAAAKGRITKSLIALAVYFFLYAILQFIIPGGVS